jgi:hypothetical protein
MQALEQANGGTDRASSVKEGIRLLEDRQYDRAVAFFEELVREAPSARSQGLLGTAYFLVERYEDAKKALGVASELDPTNAEWEEKLTMAAGNAAAAIQVDFPPVLPFSRDDLLAVPVVPPGALPDVAAGEAKKGPLQTLLKAAERLSGILGDALWRTLSPIAAQIGGTAGDVWTTWYRKPLFLGTLTLGYTRDLLNKTNLLDAYPPGTLTAFAPRGLVAPPGVKYYRTADGSWNNLANPREGSAGVRFPRNVARPMTWPRNALLLEPNPAEISHVLFRRKDGMKEVPFLNLIAGAWIQFMVHDWVSHRADTRFGVHEIPLPPDHPARARYYQTKMFIGKTAEDPTRGPSEAHLPPTAINEVTSWWDASQIYGSDQKTVESLRTLRDGKMKIEDTGLLPVDEHGLEHVGFQRNWWLGLTLLHTLFVREHNAICDMLQKHNPGWDDTRLFNVARLVNSAVMAKIHSIEWTPAILPNPGLAAAMEGNWHGLSEFFRPRKDRRIFRGFKIQNPEIGGIVGNKIDKHGAPYGLSEEFTEVYRLHELLPDELTIRSLRSGEELDKLALAATRQQGAHKVSARHSLVDLFFSFGNMHPGQLVLNNYPRTLQELSLPGNPVFDMGVVDIIRGRERGVPRYNEFRRQFGMKPIRTFEDLTDDTAQLADLKRIYKNDVELIDLQVGSRAEAHRPPGYGFGETLFQVFILNASRRLQADRFYTDSYNEETYTREGLDWVDAASMKAVLLRHYPDLAASGLSQVDNAFEPWDSGELTLDRHPLRGFNW